MILFDDTEEIKNKNLTRKLKHGVDITFKDNKYTAPITFQFTVRRNNKQANIFDRHKKIFEAMKLLDKSTNTITTAGKVFEQPKEIPLDQEYVTHLPFMNSIKNSVRSSSTAN